MKTVSIELWVAIDQDGDYEIGKEADEARERYGEQIGDLAGVDGFRLIKVTLTVPLPVVAELSGVVPAEGNPSLVAVE